MLTLPSIPVSFKVNTCHCLGTSFSKTGFKRLPMFLARKETNNTLIIDVKGSVKISRNKFERKILEKYLH